MSVDIQVKLKGPVAEDYSFLKNRYGTETITDTIRIIVRELARIVKEQLTPSLNIEEKINTLFYQGYFEEFLEELAEKEPKLFNEYTKQQSKPSEHQEEAT